jgi:hypothetical protein
MPPFLTIILLNAFAYAVAYLWIYPRWCGRNINRVMAIDCVLIALLLAVGYALFHGAGYRFSLLLFETNWVVFMIVTGAVIEFPFFLRYLQANGIELSDLNGPDDPDDRS